MSSAMCTNGDLPSRTEPERCPQPCVQMETHQVEQSLSDVLSHVYQVTHNESTAGLAEISLEGTKRRMFQHRLEVWRETQRVYFDNVLVQPERR